MKTLTVTAALLLAAGSASAQQPTPDPRFVIPSTVSPEAAARLKIIVGFLQHRPKATQPKTQADWDAQNATVNGFIGPMERRTADALKVSVTEDTLGGVPIVRIRPPNYKPTGRTLIYVHGGGYVSFSAKILLAFPGMVAVATGDEVISIDYTLAPRGTWRTATDQVLAVWRALLATGIKPGSVGLFGDSAGGGLSAGSVLKMRDQGLPLPGALYLNSPWADITATGDTIATLAAADPSLDSESLSWGANLYAEPADQKNPYVSPVYGDYAKAFPPTLIQGGTREIFLSGFVRQYQAIRSGGHEAQLDLYEGMPHTFQSLLPDTPETRTAIGRVADFFKSHLTTK